MKGNGECLLNAELKPLLFFSAVQRFSLTAIQATQILPLLSSTWGQGLSINLIGYREGKIFNKVLNKFIIVDQCFVGVFILIYILGRFGHFNSINHFETKIFSSKLHY